MRRVSTAMIGVLVLVSVLGGCANLKHGLAAPAAEQMLERMDGIRSASVTYTSIVQSTRTDPVLVVEVRMKDGATVSDPVALAAYVARVGWSTGDRDPTGGMSVSIVTEPLFNFGQALSDDRWPGVLSDSSDPGSFGLGYQKLTNRWGKWPAAPPEKLINIP